MDRDHEILDEKARLRRRLRQARQALSIESVRAASSAVVRLLSAWLSVDRLAFPTPGSADLTAPAPEPTPELALYAGVGGEIEVDALVGDGTALYPRVAAKQPPTLTFHRIRGRHALLPAAFGLLEPPHDAPAIPLGAASAVIVPSLGFDRLGHRLGQGGGYYDAALRHAPHVPRIGVGHAFQLLEQIPVESTDEPLDLIVTPDGAFPTRARPHIHPPGGSL